MDETMAAERFPRFIDGEVVSDSVPSDVGGAESLQSSEASLALSGTQLEESQGIRVQMLDQHLESMGLSVAEAESALPCTSTQDSILLAQIKGEGGAEDAYWNTSRIKLSTDDNHREGVDPHRLAKAWQAICDAQPIMRTFFVASVSDPNCAFQQVILKKETFSPSISQGPVKSRLRPAADFPKPEFVPTQPPHHVHLTRVSRYVVYVTIYAHRALVSEKPMVALGRLLHQAYLDMSALEPGPELSEYVDIDTSTRLEQPDSCGASSTSNSQVLCKNTPSVSSGMSIRDAVPTKDLKVVVASGTTTTPVKELHRLAELASQHFCFHHDNIESVVPVTEAQASMLAVSELDGKSLHNKGIIKLSEGGVDTARLFRACELVVQHQALLRTIFVQEGSQLYQAVLRSLPVRTVTISGDDEGYVQPKGIEEARYLPRFQLRADSLDDDDENSSRNSLCEELHLHIHQALYDEVSLGFILHDLQTAYMGDELSSLDTPKFSDWVLQVGCSSSSTWPSSSPTSSSSSSSSSSSEDYWRQLLRKSSTTTLSPPTRPVCGATRTSRVAFRTKTRNLHTPHGLPSSTLHAAWAAALFVATGSRDLVFGEANANRSSGSFPNAVEIPGPCRNLLPVRATFDPTETTFGSLIEQLQDQATSGIPHQHVGFRSIVKQCTDWPSCTRLGSVILYHQNCETVGRSLHFGDVDATFTGEGTIGDLTDCWITAKHVAAMTKSWRDDDEDVEIEIMYAPHRTSEEQARWMARCLDSVLASIPTHLDQPLEAFRKLMDHPFPSHIIVPVPAAAAIPEAPVVVISNPTPKPLPTRRRANTVMATVSAILEQPLDSIRKFAADGPAAAAAAAPAETGVIPQTSGGDAHSTPPPNPGPNRRRANSVLESVSTLFKQPLESFQHLMESPTTPSHILVPAAAAAAKPFVLLSGDEANSQAQALVALAWEDVGLRERLAATAGKEGGEEDNDEVSLFDCGGDLETVLMLSWWYRYRGHRVSMYDIIENPTRRGQSRLFSKKV
ncbi:nonribosomal peptide synthetase [Apiospora saccharicola]|uniref:Nonribosomal peptide synthetase n=1 Tax=Apiospora saccharicola TaxID=335842 RepID=A0ABR1VED6_9PEZI